MSHANGTTLSLPNHHELNASKTFRTNFSFVSLLFFFCCLSLWWYMVVWKEFFENWFTDVELKIWWKTNVYKKRVKRSFTLFLKVAVMIITCHFVIRSWWKNNVQQLFYLAQKSKHASGLMRKKSYQRTCYGQSSSQKKAIYMHSKVLHRS